MGEGGKEGGRREGGTHILEEEKEKKGGRERVNQLPKTSATQLIIKTRTVIYIFFLENHVCLFEGRGEGKEGCS